MTSCSPASGQRGREILRNFSNFSASRFIEEAINEIKNKVGTERAVAACSGGVDSMTSTLLAHRAMGDRLTAVYIDDGFRREGEPEWVMRLLKRLGIRARLEEKSKEFFDALKMKVDPEEKRKAFREKFYSVIGKVVEEAGGRYMVQGTIAADIAETVGGIKTQHNVLEQIGIGAERYGFKLLEPVRGIYKPQVREVAREIGLPPEVVGRAPFPGPGLAIRVLGEVTPERVAIVRKATQVVEEETGEVKSFQSFAVLLSDRCTGVVNGRRAYGRIIVVRVVSSEDAMTAKAIQVPYQILGRVSRRIVGEIPGVVRCLFDLTNKPPATIEFE